MDEIIVGASRNGRRPMPIRPLRTCGAGGLEFTERILAVVHWNGRLFVRVRVRVKVGRVVGSDDLGNDGGSALSRQNRFPVAAREELVFLDVIHAVLEAAVTLRQVGREQSLNKRFRVAVKVPREVNLAGQDLLIDAHRVVVAERRLPGEHFKDQDAEGPPVDAFAVPLVQQDFGCNVFGCSAQRQQVLRLQVANLVVLKSNRPALRKCVKNSPPITYSSTMYKQRVSWNVPARLTMKG
ncbi:hypothetical protein, variant [Aphanomyces invadans]|uniref:Uncharacterized protein n=1 Tax=Aphanomyces invadans TaxID=157072 RepID=A0A024UBR2_9STRA|nr:hypothetical protein H310_05038 [Aphanomyces invadans]XP_008867869.1 hypothetical protein, variant [Aphanomyces invadans]ETW03639.1 hypothetical protein H310_05038 [Aphanomyces invadans]ETW03640.1 hypothetical protein, variant [Aphanomyces invadans]|eukprot:XP_008867868.1 hypothetical protein H310_05038 [Aphanomyces invadans]